MFNSKAYFYLKIVFLLSLIALISAYFIEYVLEHQPCNLCLLERIPYGISLILITIIFILKKNEKFFIILLIITSLFSFTISIYHFGIEQGFFEESSICNVRSFTETLSKEDLLQQLNKKIVSCKDVTFKIFGFSLTTINIVISFLFIITFLKIYKIYEKNR
mgnify:CR=1 FL=1|tara:strand:- start:133 stop:618 length:486 start_codon:yes stop_codon:yes gene_type:complete